MTLTADEFMRRFLLHVLPGGFHRIRHFGLIANNGRKEKLALVRELLEATCAPQETAQDQGTSEPLQPTYICRHCGSAMLIIETIARGKAIRAPPALRWNG
jgi:hypothetical protein